MAFLAPYSPVRPKPPVKAKSKDKANKLSLKYRQKTAQLCEENTGQALLSKERYPVRNAELYSGKDMFSSFISSDASSLEDKFLSESTFFERSALQVPQAESTRLEISLRLSKESNPESYFSCKSQLTPPSGNSSDEEEPEGACEESIIYISDEESLPLTKTKTCLNIVVPESTESDSTGGEKGHHSENKDETIILDTSSDESFIRKKHFIGKTVLSQLNDVSKKKKDQWRNIVIPPSSSGSDESKDVIDSSLNVPGLTRKRDRNVDSPSSRKSPVKKNLYTPVRRIISESSEDELSTQEQDEISPRTLAAEKLSQTKAIEIQRWIDGHDLPSHEGYGADNRNQKSSTSPANGPERQQGDGESSCDDSFDELIRREKQPPKETPVHHSSFIVDSSSSDGSFSNYRKILTKDLREDVNNVERVPLGVLTGRPTPRVRRRRNILSDSSETESDAGSSSSSEWDPDSSRDKKRGRQPAKKFVHEKRMEPKIKQLIPYSQKANSNSDTGAIFKKPDDTPRTLKKSDDTPRTLKKSDDTPRTFKKSDDTPRTLKKPDDTPRTLKKSDDTPRTFKKPDDTIRTVKKPVNDTPRPPKKPVNDTPRPVKKSVKDTPRTTKKLNEDGFRTPTSTPKTGSKHVAVEELKKSGTPYSPIRTFLTSLSGPAKDPSLRNHPEASIYFKNYKSKREELARRLFKLFNREVFDSRLPDDLLLEWSGRMSSTAGYCSCKLVRKPDGPLRTARIVLSSKILDSAERLRDTLIHELCHAAVWLLNQISGGHGPFWKAWARKAERRFPELPNITVCHGYNVETKFTYRCVDCGYSFGRHSKSINLQTQRCGHCYGTFELLVNKGGNRGGSAIPATPKPPTGFALFVKENYGSVKKEHGDKKHGDIMKLLGQKFAEVKIAQRNEF